MKYDVIEREPSYRKIKIDNSGDFPGSPEIKTLHSHCKGCGFDPWSEN